MPVIFSLYPVIIKATGLGVYLFIYLQFVFFKTQSQSLCNAHIMACL